MKQRRMVLAGGSGFIGQILTGHFLNQAWEIIVLTRSPRQRDGKHRECYWDGRTLGEWPRELDGADVLINLAGRSVNCRYHPRNRRLMLDSRVDSTRILGEAIGGCDNPPRLWLNSSTPHLQAFTRPAR
jgi:NAD dependent epimerase/dehydratase family enzyme